MWLGRRRHGRLLVADGFPRTRAGRDRLRQTMVEELERLYPDGIPEEIARHLDDRVRVAQDRLFPIVLIPPPNQEKENT